MSWSLDDRIRRDRRRQAGPGRRNDELKLLRIVLFRGAFPGPLASQSPLWLLRSGGGFGPMAHEYFPRDGVGGSWAGVPTVVEWVSPHTRKSPRRPASFVPCCGSATQSNITPATRSLRSRLKWVSGCTINNPGDRGWGDWDSLEKRVRNPRSRKSRPQPALFGARLKWVSGCTINNPGDRGWGDWDSLEKRVRNPRSRKSPRQPALFGARLKWARGVFSTALVAVSEAIGTPSKNAPETRSLSFAASVYRG
jgi:hypothetical protein